MFEENIFGLPNWLLNVFSEELEDAKRKILSKGAIKTFSESHEDFSAIFTDGSNVVDERRGCGVALFSSISILFRRENGELKYMNMVNFSPEEYLLILFPKYRVGGRANTIMRGLEYLSALSLLEESGGVDFLVFDGSYVTTLVDPRASIREIYSEIVRISKNKLRNGDAYREKIFELLKVVDEVLYKHLEDLFKSSPKEISKNFFAEYYNIYRSAFENALDKLNEADLIDIKSHIQNYLFMLLENNFVIVALKKLLEKLMSLGLKAIWISKDAEGRHITKEFGKFSLSNDLSLIDHVLGPRQYLRVRDVVEELSRIEPDRVYISKSREIDAVGKVHAVLRGYALTVYKNFKDYEIIYAKLNGPAIQITYPSKLVDLNELEDILGKLFKISKFGYPQPLYYAHMRAKIREKTAEILAEALYKVCSQSGNNVLCNLMRESGRKLLL